jgi:hypothetical protein
MQHTTDNSCVPILAQLSLVLGAIRLLLGKFLGNGGATTHPDHPPPRGLPSYKHLCYWHNFGHWFHQEKRATYLGDKCIEEDSLHEHESVHLIVDCRPLIIAHSTNYIPPQTLLATCTPTLQ